MGTSLWSTNITMRFHIINVNVCKTKWWWTIRRFYFPALGFLNLDQYRSSHSPCSYHNLVSWKPSTGAHCPRVKMYMYALCKSTVLYNDNIDNVHNLTTAFNTILFPPVFKNCIHQHHNSICNVRMYVIAYNYL